MIHNGKHAPPPPTHIHKYKMMGPMNKYVYVYISN